MIKSSGSPRLQNGGARQLPSPQPMISNAPHSPNLSRAMKEIAVTQNGNPNKQQNLIPTIREVTVTREVAITDGPPRSPRTERMVYTQHQHTSPGPPRSPRNERKVYVQPEQIASGPPRSPRNERRVFVQHQHTAPGPPRSPRTERKVYAQHQHTDAPGPEMTYTHHLHAEPQAFTQTSENRTRAETLPANVLRKSQNLDTNNNAVGMSGDDAQRTREARSASLPGGRKKLTKEDMEEELRRMYGGLPKTKGIHGPHHEGHSEFCSCKVKGKLYE